VPLVGRKDPATKTPDGSTGGKADASATATKSRRKLLSRKVRAGQAPSDKKKAESKRAKKKAPTTSVERRRRIPVALAGVFALAVLATNFPLSSILGQHAQLSSASAQLQRVRQQNRALIAQEDALKSNVAINELARGDLQMVTPGQTLYDVLPPSNNTDNTTPGSPTSGDPGDQPLVAPDNAPDLSPQQVLPTPIPAAADGASATVSTKSAKATEVSPTPVTPSPRSSYWGRVADTLEFWR
jgi:cell division protein FtsB